MMLIAIVGFVTTAISLNYFTRFALDNALIFKAFTYNLVFFWKRISTFFLVATLAILWEEPTKNLFVDTLSSDLVNGYNIIHLYNGFLSLNHSTVIVEGVILVVALISINICSGNSSKPREQERYIFVLSATIGGLILLTGHEFLTIFLGLELQSYSVYLLAASFKNYEPSESAGLKYFLLGALSSALIFLGLALLYIYSGNSNFDTFSYLITCAGNSQTSISPITSTSSFLIPFMGILLILTGFVWKIAGAPVHAWAIDVYDAVPSKVSAIISLLPKVALTVFIVKILSNLSLTSLNYSFEHGFSIVIIPFVIVVLSLIVGSFSGLFTQRVKRILGYSSVLNMGFILMGGLLVIDNGSEVFNPLFYIVQYIFSTLAIWLSLILLTNFNGTNTEIVLITQLQQRAVRTNAKNLSVNIKATGISICITILILSVAGIPPMIGFFAKFEIIYLTLKNDHLVLAFVAIIASVLSTVYYLNVVKNIWFVAPSVAITQQLYYLNFIEIKNKDNIVGFTLAFITLSVILAFIQYPLIFVACTAL